MNHILLVLILALKESVITEHGSGTKLTSQAVL